MSKYTVGAIASSDQPTAKTVALGGNFRVYLSPVNVKEIARVTASADNTAALVDIGDTAITAAGADLVAAVRSTILRPPEGVSGNPLVTLEVTDGADAGSIAATATFNASAIAAYQGDEYQKGYAVDIAVASSETIKSLDALTSVANMRKGSQVSIYELPDYSTFKLVNQTDSFGFPSTAPDPLNIPSGLNTSGYTVTGPSKVPEISMAQKFLSNEEMIQRLAGTRCSLMVEILKDDLTLSDRFILTESIVNWEVDSGEGASPATRNVNGIFKEALYFFSAS